MKTFFYKFINILRENSLFKRIWDFSKRTYFCIFSIFKKKPDFLIIGAMKSGTTYMFNLLRQHPQFAAPVEKEIHYFDCNYKQGGNWYINHFPFKTKIKKITGEASPYYLYHPLAAQRSYNFNKNFKIIILLRDPVERAISHYNMFSKMLNIKWDLNILLHYKEELLIQKYMESKIVNNIQDYNKIHRNFSFISRGIYLSQIKRWHDFFSKDRVVIIKSEDFYNYTQNIMDEICDFLEIERFNNYNFNVDKYIGNYKNKVDENICSVLKDFYKPYNEELEKYLKRKFNWDL